MTEQYYVSWVDTITGKSGHATDLMSYELCMDWCNVMNKKYPEITHTPVKAESFSKSP